MQQKKKTLFSFFLVKELTLPAMQPDHQRVVAHDANLD